MINKTKEDGYLIITTNNSNDKVLIKCILPLKYRIEQYLNAIDTNIKNNLNIKKICVSMNRSLMENINSFSKRFSINLKKHLDNYLNKSLKIVKLNVLTKITNENEQEYKNLTIEDLIKNNSMYFCKLNLTINEFKQDFYFLIKKNFNFVESVTIRNEIIWGLPIVPLITFYRGNIEDFEYIWYIGKHESIENKKCEQILDLPNELLEIDNNYICNINIHDKDLYLKIGQDVENYCLIFRIVNKNEKLELFDTIYKICNIKRPVERNYYENRIKCFKRDLEENDKFNDRIRIVSFNILSELFSQTIKALNEMYKDCPGFALESFYRRSLLAKELIDLDSDILCLQEIQLSFYDSFLNILLTQKGYSGIFHSEFASVSTFYKKDLFELIEAESFLFRNLIHNYPELIEFIKVEWPDFLEKILKNVSTVFQIIILRNRKTDNIYLFANTHLYYHQFGGHIRILQVKLLMDLINDYLKKLKNNFYNKTIIPLIMGDFNTLPFSDARRLLINGYISKNSSDWLHSKIYTPENISESFYKNTNENYLNNEICGIDIKLNNKCIDLFNINIDKKYSIKFKLKTEKLRKKVSESRDFDEELYYPFTNKVNGFSGQLDYIYLVECEEITNKYDIYINKYLPYVEEYSLLPIKTLPSPEYPSDHISVGIDITFKKKEKIS